MLEMFVVDDVFAVVVVVVVGMLENKLGQEGESK